MKPFFILISVFVISLAVTKLINSSLDVQLSGKIALSAMLLFTSIGHFKFTKGMSAMLPNFTPYKIEIIYITGILEILAAFGIFVPSLEKTTGIFLIIFFILILPANIYASIKKINYETGKSNGKGLPYLWFRIPFQILLIAWTYFFVLK